MSFTDDELHATQVCAHDILYVVPTQLVHTPWFFELRCRSFYQLICCLTLASKKNWRPPVFGNEIRFTKCHETGFVVSPQLLHWIKCWKGRSCNISNRTLHIQTIPIISYLSKYLSAGRRPPRPPVTLPGHLRIRNRGYPTRPLVTNRVPKGGVIAPWGALESKWGALENKWGREKIK
ncbi:hypothetical protein RF11_15844 [Thelohanellus kitauei]|uniref:Uncharacterized protein n=1 Tax=Thelohanellus kitauei TaxID=669202 RepID=A0A0C2MBQ4_THEKT|nr:hypothetical protein RF11_15844 [Thelohanellus kitauei]